MMTMVLNLNAQIAFRSCALRRCTENLCIPGRLTVAGEGFPVMKKKQMYVVTSKALRPVLRTLAAKPYEFSEQWSEDESDEDDNSVFNSGELKEDLKLKKGDANANAEVTEKTPNEKVNLVDAQRMRNFDFLIAGDAGSVTIILRNMIVVASSPALAAILAFALFGGSYLGFLRALSTFKSAEAIVKAIAPTLLKTALCGYVFQNFMKFGGGAAYVFFLKPMAAGDRIYYKSIEYTVVRLELHDAVLVSNIYTMIGPKSIQDPVVCRVSYYDLMENDFVNFSKFAYRVLCASIKFPDADYDAMVDKICGGICDVLKNEEQAFVGRTEPACIPFAFADDEVELKIQFDVKNMDNEAFFRYYGRVMDLIRKEVVKAGSRPV